MNAEYWRECLTAGHQYKDGACSQCATLFLMTVEMLEQRELDAICGFTIKREGVDEKENNLAGAHAEINTATGATEEAIETNQDGNVERLRAGAE